MLATMRGRKGKLAGRCRRPAPRWRADTEPIERSRMPAFIPPVGAAIVRKQNRIVAAFRAAGATARERATTVAALGVREGLALRILRRHAILRDAGEQRLYLDEPIWEAHQAKRRRIALGIMAAMLLVATVAIIWAILR